MCRAISTGSGLKVQYEYECEYAYFCSDIAATDEDGALKYARVSQFVRISVESSILIGLGNSRTLRIEPFLKVGLSRLDACCMLNVSPFQMSIGSDPGFRGGTLHGAGADGGSTSNPSMLVSMQNGFVNSNMFS